MCTEFIKMNRLNMNTGRFENTIKSHINLNQMGSNGTYKNKTYLSKGKIQKCIFALESAFENKNNVRKCARMRAF